ncbi:glycoside hydrolase family 32 protein [Larkinella arboricola]
MKRISCILYLCCFSLLAVAQAPVSTAMKSRQIPIKKGQTYLNLPVNNSSRLIRARVKVGGKALDQFTIKLAEGKPDFWTFFDVTPYQGKTLTVEIENAPPGPRQQPQESQPTELSTRGLDQIFADSSYPGQEDTYKEKGRPQVHYSAQRGWINDPNGLVYANGEYHLYYQHNPYGWDWGNMHWGHAVSKDLLHWTELKEALYPVLDLPDNKNDAAFSGSAVVDTENTTGFRKNGIDPIIAFYTSTGRGECIMLSYDKGRTFTEYAGNPILKHSGRDPKILWYAPGKHWVMVVWSSGKPKKIGLNQEVSLREHSIYTSPDMKSWTYQSGVSGFFECPDLFELPVEGQPGTKKWVMYDAHGRYVVGIFDGKKFNVEQPFKKYDHGGGYFYAAQTFNNMPDNRRVQIGWGRNITNPGMPFNQPMLFPTELKLKNSFDGLRLCPTPIREITTLHKSSETVRDKVVTSDASVSVAADKDTPLHIIAEIERGDAPITLNIHGYELRYDNEWEFSTTPVKSTAAASAQVGPFAPPSTAAPVSYVSASDVFKIEAIVDKNIIEFYVNDGELYYATEFSGEKTGKVEAVVKANRGGRPETRKFIVKKLEVHQLNSIWTPKK